MVTRLRWLLPFLSCLSTQNICAEENADSAATELKEIVVKRDRSDASGTYEGEGRYRFVSEGVASGARVLGEADIVNAIKRSGAASAASSYASGLSVDGADPSQTAFTLNGAKIFFPYRFGGIFSVFNTMHFSGASFDRDIHTASFPTVIGARLDYASRTRVPERVRGNVNVGLISSSASLGIPAGKRFVINAAARVSYINALYSKFLSLNSAKILYDFSDYNLSATYHAGDADRITFEGYFGNDAMKYNEPRYNMNLRIGWRNSLATASWQHSGEGYSAQNRAYFTSFNNTFDVSVDTRGFDMPSDIRCFGASGNWNIYSPEISAGYELEYHSIKPQYKSEFFGGNLSERQSASQKTFMPRLFFDKTFRFGEAVSLQAGLSASLWINGSYISGGVDPRVTFKVDCGNSAFNFHVGKYTQYIHQVGLSDLGLASNFFIGADAYVPVQRALSGVVSWDWKPVHGLSFVVEPYYRLLSGQTEYQGQVLDMYQSSYSPQTKIITGHGYNTGFNIGLHKTSGQLTGNIVYSFGCAIRKSEAYPYTYRSVNDAGNRLNVNAEYHAGKHFTFAATFVYADGRPFTPVKAAYIISKNLISDYGRRNSSRFPSTHQLDFSATYSFIIRVGRFELMNSINATIINAYGHNNVELQYYDIDTETGDVYLRQVSSLYRFMPSISYSIDF